MIDRAQATKLYDVYQRAFTVLCEGYEVIGNIPEGSERDEALADHAQATDAVVFGLRARLLAQYPDLEEVAPAIVPSVFDDPLSQVIDTTLVADAGMLERLSVFGSQTHFAHLPGDDPAKENERLSQILGGLVSELLAGIETNPTKRWVMAQFQRRLVQLEQEDTEARERFGEALEQIMEILRIPSSDGLLSFYLGGI